jgi:hypothetical protein
MEQQTELQSPIFLPRPGWGGQLREWSKTNRRLLMILSAIILVLIGSSFFFRGNPDVTQATPTPTPNTNQVSVTAQTGDSITTLARRALNTYLLANSATVSDIQELFIETQLKNIIGEFRLSVGQTVHFPVSSIQQAIRNAENMTPYQIQYYSQFVR